MGKENEANRDKVRPSITLGGSAVVGAVLTHAKDVVIKTFTNHVPPLGIYGEELAIGALGGVIGAASVPFIENDVTVFESGNVGKVDERATRRTHKALQAFTVVGYGGASTLFTPGDPRVNAGINALCTFVGVMTARKARKINNTP